MAAPRVDRALRHPRARSTAAAVGLVVGAMLLTALFVSGAGPAILALAVGTPIVMWVLARPQRGILLLAALIPFNGLLLLGPRPWYVAGWKEAILILVVAATFVCPHEARGSTGRRPPAWFPAVVGLFALAILSGTVVGGVQAAVGLKVGFFASLAGLAAWRCPLDSAERDGLVTILMVTGLIAALVGLGQQVIGAQALADLGYEWNETIRFAGDTLRSFSTFNQPFGFAFFLMVVLLVGLPVALDDPKRRRNSLFLIATPILGVAILTPIVRAAWLGLALGLLYLGFRRYRILLLGFPVALVIFLLLPTGTVSPALSSESLGTRTESWSDNVDEIALNPFGAGIGASGSAAEKVVEVELDTGDAAAELAALRGEPETFQPDNYYFKTALELGVLGFWLLVLLFAAGFLSTQAIAANTVGFDRAFTLGIAAQVLAVAVASLVATYLEIFPMDIYFWLLLGVAATCNPGSR